MADDPPDDVHALWSSQPLDAIVPSLEEIHARANQFQRRVGFRNASEYLAAVAVIVIFTGYAWKASTWLSRVGPALVVLGALAIVFQLFRRGASRVVPGNDGGAAVAESCIRFHRTELERQRDLLRAVWRWYLGPLIPGMSLMLLDELLSAWNHQSGTVVEALGSIVLSALVFVAVGWLNQRAARRLEREIASLPSDTL